MRVFSAVPVSFPSSLSELSSISRVGGDEVTNTLVRLFSLLGRSETPLIAAFWSRKRVKSYC